MRQLMLISLLGLAACGTPFERCNRDATRLYSDAMDERADIARDLERGFTYVTDWETRNRWRICGVHDGLPFRCWRTETEPVTRRVPVNATALLSRDATLEAQLPQLRADAAAGQTECRQRYPAEAATAPTATSDT